MCLCVLLLIYAVQVDYYWHYTNDDAYITFRYSRQMAAGNGPCYNAGEHVEGYTNFSLMMLMALIIRIFGPGAVPFAAKLPGVLFGGSTMILAFFLFRNIFRSWPDRISVTGGLLAAGIVSVTPAYALNSTSGLETLMFSFFLILGLWLTTLEDRKQKWMGASAAFSVMVLTRPEGILLFGLFWLTRVIILIRREKQNNNSGPDVGNRSLLQSKPLRLTVTNGAVVVLVYAIHLVFRILYYDGEWLPNTYYAKQGGFWAVTAWPYIAGGLLKPVFGIAGLLFALTGYVINRRRIPLNILPFTVLAAGAACLPFITGTDWMPGWRFAIPYLPLIAVMTTGGWLALLERFPLKTGLHWIILAALPGVLWFHHDSDRRSLHYHTVFRSRGYATGHAALAKWIKPLASQDDIIVLMDIGIIGYACIDQSILDLTGLTDRYIAKSPGTFLNKTYDPGYIFQHEPEFIVLVLTAPGRAYRTPPPDTKFIFWTPMESRLYEHQDFQEYYIRKDTEKAAAWDWLEAKAGQIGAVRIFEHAHPGMYYLLAVFRRHENPGLSPGKAMP